jgi:hypothetical protein
MAPDDARADDERGPSWTVAEPAAVLHRRDDRATQWDKERGEKPRSDGEYARRPTSAANASAMTSMAEIDSVPVTVASSSKTVSRSRGLYSPRKYITDTATNGNVHSVTVVLASAPAACAHSRVSANGCADREEIDAGTHQGEQALRRTDDWRRRLGARAGTGERCGTDEEPVAASGA